MHLVTWLTAAKTLAGAALLVNRWPSRRYMRRLQRDLAEARRYQILRAVEQVSRPEVDLVPLVSALENAVSAARDIQVTQASTGPVRLRPGRGDRVARLRAV